MPLRFQASAVNLASSSSTSSLSSASLSTRVLSSQKRSSLSSFSDLSPHVSPSHTSIILPPPTPTLAPLSLDPIYAQAQQGRRGEGEGARGVGSFTRKGELGLGLGLGLGMWGMGPKLNELGGTFNLDDHEFEEAGYQADMDDLEPDEDSSHLLHLRIDHHHRSKVPRSIEAPAPAPSVSPNPITGQKGTTPRPPRLRVAAPPSAYSPPKQCSCTYNSEQDSPSSDENEDSDEEAGAEGEGKVGGGVDDGKMPVSGGHGMMRGPHRVDSGRGRSLLVTGSARRSRVR